MLEYDVWIVPEACVKIVLPSECTRLVVVPIVDAFYYKMRESTHVCGCVIVINIHYFLLIHSRRSKFNQKRILTHTHYISNN